MIYNRDRGLYPGQREALINIIDDSWHNLLAVYDELEVIIDKDYYRHVTRNYFIQEESREGRDLFEYEMGIQYNDTSVGIFRVKTGFSSFSISDFQKFTSQAAGIRKQFKNSLLLPYGYMILLGPKMIWSNAIADELLFRTDLEINLLRELLQENPDHEPVVLVKDVEINGFDLTVISIPILSEKEITGNFMILAESEWKNIENSTTVIKEIHHRVKNNLQTIASLLRLQMRRNKTRTVEKALQESINKISSIALIHEELSKGGIEKINIKATIASIMEMIISTMVPADKDIKGELVGSDIYADANTTSMLSLCITELIQNSVEHAFQFRKKGTITVKVEESEEMITVSVEDDGVGFTRKKDKNSLGLEIIEMITKESLKGTFTIEGHLYGCKSTIQFPLAISGREL